VRRAQAVRGTTVGPAHGARAKVGCERSLGQLGSIGRDGMRRLLGPNGLFHFLGKPKCFSIIPSTF
jgi:hypothetical protein